jgi:hypothetical protein
MVNSAGILPISRNDRGEVVFLIGRDLRDGVFSDFGGKIEPVDAGDPIHTATREFYEESLGALCNSPYELRKRVRDLSVCLIGSTKNLHVYRMYVVEFPYDPFISQRFKKIVNFLKYKNIGSNYIEKTEVLWATFDELVKIPKRKVFTDTLDRNMSILRRITVEPWRALCEEHKNYSTDFPSMYSSPSSTSGNKYLHPHQRNIQFA